MQKGNMDMNNDKLSFKLIAYERCFDSKHHYDNLSWVIGGILFIFVGALFAYLSQIKDGYQLWFIFVSPKRLITAFFSCLFLYVWYVIYERNRFWAEVANEKIREFEREFQIEGIGIKFMKANKDGFITLQNTDEKGEGVENPREISLKKISIDIVIRISLILIGITIFVACFIP
jgi:Ca2+/Na+ antiporter